MLLKVIVLQMVDLHCQEGVEEELPGMGELQELPVQEVDLLIVQHQE